MKLKKLLLATCGALVINSACALEKGIVNNTDSPYIKLKSINIGDAQWTEGFWADKWKMAEQTMIPNLGEIFKGPIGFAYDNYKLLASGKKGEAGGKYWHDGDFYKWMESMTYLYAQNKDEKILAELDEIIAVIGKAQADDGYLSTHVQIRGLKRYGNIHYHELYNSGHLITSAVIHHRITGKTNFLKIALKNANFLYKTFQPQDPELARFGFNPSQIMALVELYRETKERKYLELAEIFVNMRGSVPNEEHHTVADNFRGDFNQMETPIREEKDAVGHVVLAMYLYAGTADVYGETGEQALLDALDRIWSSAVERKMYVTGAMGQTHHGASGKQNMVHEAFQDDYLMPNKTAYNETCANISNAMFNWRMLGIKGEAKYGDVMERVMYNSALVGVSVEGKDFFYSNPLRMIEGGIDPTKKGVTTERDERVPYIPVFCCPPNLARTLAKLSGWSYSLSKDGVAVNLYGGNKLNTKLVDGSALSLTQETNYPWDGKVKITVNKAKSSPFDVMLRIPEWAEGSVIKINGKAFSGKVEAGKFATVIRKWSKGDVITLDMPMEIDFIEGDPRIEEVRNQVAVQRGPVVYAIESPDLPKSSDILDVYLKEDAKFKVHYRPDFLGGVATLDGTLMLRNDEGTGMYRKLKKAEFTPYETKLVPYFAWSNRGKAEMTIFMPLMWDK